MNRLFGFVLLLSCEWSLSHTVDLLIYTVGGNANGESCVFPFKYKSKWYSYCTSDGGPDGLLWCATTAYYDSDKKWGYCPQNVIYTEGGNANGQPCVFPFTYKSKWYWNCTTDGSYSWSPWCATTTNVDKDNKWGKCLSQVIYTKGGNANGEPCVFPFKYKSRWHLDCITDGTTDGSLWCSTTLDYDKDKKRGNCIRKLTDQKTKRQEKVSGTSLPMIYAEGGNANGEPCVFPFNYASKWYLDCTSDGSSDGHLWCATTADYNKDKKWGYCSQKVTDQKTKREEKVSGTSFPMIYAEGGNANGELCVFPFNYESKWYSDCTSDGTPNGRLWCATTADYNNDKKWGYCPQKGEKEEELYTGEEVLDPANAAEEAN